MVIHEPCYIHLARIPERHVDFVSMPKRSFENILEWRQSQKHLTRYEAERDNTFLDVAKILSQSR